METPVSAPTSNQFSPAIYDSNVIWQDCGANPSCPNSAIFIYNLLSGLKTQISDGLSVQQLPAIYGNRIVWQDNRNSGNYEIFINGTAPGQEYSLSPNAEVSSTYPPGIAGTWVVWVQTDNSNYDIYVNNTSSNQITPIALDLPGVELASISFSPLNSLYRIVWDEQDASNYNVYLYTSGSSVTCPVASFTNNVVCGSSSPSVTFTDTSSQKSSITNWSWDFGDGSNSTLENPTHTYATNGAYTVSLTVSNSLCRNTTTVTNSVVLGGPVAGFNASPTSGIVPAIISFTDTSIGCPTQWNWSWGDGTWTNGTTQNPVHEYTTPGQYSVTLIASNPYGSGSTTQSNYIQVLNGANVLTNTSITGLTFMYTGSRQNATLDDTILAPWTFPLYPNVSVLEFTPPADRGFGNITLYACDGIGFSTGGHQHTGNITEVHLQTGEIVPVGFSASTGGPFCSVNYSVDLAKYPENALLDTQVWEGSVPPDTSNFNTVASGSGFGGTNQTAYTVKVFKTNFPAGGTAILHMSLNASWVASKPEGTNEVFVERIDDSGTYGQVLGTHFLYHNSTSNLDYFEADSPNGLSTFGLSFLEGAGNLFQFITLAVSSQVQNQAQGHYAGSGSWSQSGNAPDTYSPTAVQTQVVPQATQSPSQTAAVPPSAPPNAGASPPAPTAVSTDVGIIGWLAETVGGHIYLVAGVVITVVSLLYIRQRRRRFDPLG
jgi:beta propeller repeat protein